VLWRNRFAVHPRYGWGAFIITLMACGNSVLSLVHWLCYGLRADRTPIRQPPIFIIGHWRTGTTWLHELLCLDERHTFPTSYSCVAPHHFLLSEAVFTRLRANALPAVRPMDNMRMGWDKPQEDEFALSILGAPSPYAELAFPNRWAKGYDTFDIDTLPERAQRRWKNSLLTFLRRLTFRDPRRLVLKSPTHSCRVKVLNELFPDALFIHIVRDPYTVYPSTIKMWKALTTEFGLQRPTCDGLEETVLDTFNHVYARLDEGRRRIDQARWYEVRYEDMVSDPEGEMRKLYDALGLGGFDRLLPRLREYLEASADYQTNHFKPLDPATEARITERWGDVIRRYGYAVRPSRARSVAE
jgi:hypothetical protein